jgi:hypothetical protein
VSSLETKNDFNNHFDGAQLTIVTTALSLDLGDFSTI